MLNWNTVPMVVNDSFTYMEWLGKLTYLIGNHEDRIDTAEKDIVDLKDDVNELFDWKTDVVDPFIEEATAKFIVLEDNVNELFDWKTDTVDPFIASTTTRLAAAEDAIGDLEDEVDGLTKVVVVNEEIDTPAEEALGLTYTFPWLGDNRLCELNLHFTPGTISLGQYPFNPLNLTLAKNDTTVHKAFIQMITGAYSGEGTIAYCTISYYKANDEIKVAITDGYTFDLTTGQAAEMDDEVLAEIGLDKAICKFYSIYQ